MPRANRHFLSGHVWHITHRCHERAFLLKFARDRRNYLHWLFEAKKRFGLCVLNYMVTCNHIHLLVIDTGGDVIARSMQLIAGRTAQEYNKRKKRQGAFWEDRYHATAIEAESHLHHCVVYIDLNMVRAGAVTHPAQWEESGYREIETPRERYTIVALATLSRLCGFTEVTHFQQAHQQWVTEALSAGMPSQEPCWSESIAVGGRSFVQKLQHELGSRAKQRTIAQAGDMWTLKESRPSYGPNFNGENDQLRVNEGILWDETREDAGT